MRIGVTGASGVLGRLLIKELNKERISYSTYGGDIRDRDAVLDWLINSGSDAVVHLAARVPVEEVKNNPLEAFQVNVEGTINICLAASQSEYEPWLFYASTCHVYESSPVPIPEDGKISPKNIYAETKLLGEQVTEYFGRHLGLFYCIGRIFSFYHDSQTPPFLYPTIRERVVGHNSGEPLDLNGADEVRDILNAEDVVRIIAALIRKRPRGIINIGSGHGRRIRDFVQDIAPHITIRGVQQQAPTTYIADISRLRRVLADDDH